MAIVSPFYYRLGPESVYAYFREIALHSPIDITLYNIPMFASPIDVPTIRRLAELDKICGIKDSSGDVAFMMRMIAAVRPVRPDFVFLTGWEVVLVPMLLLGCDGGTHASSGVVPELTRQLYDLTKAGKIEAAIKLQYRLLEFFDVMLFSADFPDGFRAAAELRGFNFGRSRQPLSQTQQVNRTAVQRVLQCILADNGYVDEPCGGCAAQRQPGAGPRRTNRPGSPPAPPRARCRLNVSAPPSAAALGLIEVHSWTASIAVLDCMEKAANIRLLQIEINDLYGACIKVAGPVSDLAAALDSGRAVAESMAASCVVRPHQQPRRPRAGRLERPREFSPLIETDVVHFPHAYKELLMPDQSPFAIGLIETQGLIGCAGTARTSSNAPLNNANNSFCMKSTSVSNFRNCNTCAAKKRRPSRSGRLLWVQRRYCAAEPLMRML